MTARTDVWKPNSTVATIVVKDDRFLLVEEWSQGRLVYNQPAGHVEKGESLLDAAIRETLEETGWTVKITGLLGLYINEVSDHTTYHRHAFIAEPVSYDANLPLDTGIEGAVWLSWEELVAQQEKMRSEAVLKCFEDYRAGRRFPLDFIYDFNHPQADEA
ncbi:MAG: NUDIX hydrolase [Sphingomonadaceae bacterium]|nr:NUDIX hydrolase [Sphingomonadaceae bacterium]